MSLTAPGTGSSPPGGPQQMTPLEIELTAATANLRTQLGVLKDSMEVPFSQLDKTATWKYQSTPSNPVLAPLVRVRVGSSAPKETDKTWTKEFNYLLDQLPADLKNQYLVQSKLPYEERSQAFQALDTILGATAKAIVWIKAASKPLETSLALENMALYHALPDFVRNGAVVNASTVLESAHDFLNEQGHNMVHFDGLTKFVSQIDSSLNELNRLVNTNKDSSAFQVLAKNLDILNTQLNRIYLGDDLQILKPMVGALNLVTAASTLDTGAAPLLIGLSVANIGIDKGIEGGGALPPLLAQMRDKISEGLLASLLPNASIGSRQLLPLLVTTALVSTVAFMQMAYPDQSKGIFPLELALHMAITSGVVSSVSTGVVQASGANTKTEALASDILACAAVLLMIHTAAPDNRSTAVSLNASLQPYLSRMLDRIEQFTSDTIKAQGSQNPELRALAVFAQQAKMALQAQDHEGLEQTTLDASSLLKASDDQESVVRQQMNDFKNFIATVWNALVVKQEQLDNPTGIIQG